MNDDPANIVVERISGTLTFLDAAKLASLILDSRDICFLSSRSSWRAVTVADVTSSGMSEDVFEATWFGAAGELRWLRNGSTGRCAATLIDLTFSTETAAAGLLAAPGRVEHEVLVRRYLCWPIFGQSAGPVVTLKDGRTAKLRVPISPTSPQPTGTGVVLEAWELLERIEFGNVRVADQILRGIHYQTGEVNQ